MTQLTALGAANGMNLGGTCSSKARVASSEVSAVAGAGACPGINGRDRRPANLVEDGLVHEVELSRQSVGGV